MAKIEQFKCDGCGKVREPSNHWWTVLAETSPLKARPFVITIRPIVEQERDEWMKDFCGQQCALAFISAQMAGGK